MINDLSCFYFIPEYHVDMSLFSAMFILALCCYDFYALCSISIVALFFVTIL